jgi:hypothetical protein
MTKDERKARKILSEDVAVELRRRAKDAGSISSSGTSFSYRRTGISHFRFACPEYGRSRLPSETTVTSSTIWGLTRHLSLKADPPPLSVAPQLRTSAHGSHVPAADMFGKIYSVDGLR